MGRKEDFNPSFSISYHNGATENNSCSIDAAIVSTHGKPNGIRDLGHRLMDLIQVSCFPGAVVKATSCLVHSLDRAGCCLVGVGVSQMEN